MRHFFVTILAIAAVVNIGCQNTSKSSLEQLDNAPLNNNDSTTQDVLRREYTKFWSTDQQSPQTPIRVHGGIEP